jgi:hypothetical protein
MAMALDNVSGFIYTKSSKYPIDINEKKFTFDTDDESEKIPDDIIELYKKEMEKKQ